MKVTLRHLASTIHEGANLFLHEGVHTYPNGQYDEDGNILSVGGQTFTQTSTAVDGVHHFRSQDGKTAQYDAMTGLATVASGAQVRNPLLSVSDVEHAIKTGLANAGIELGSLTQQELRLITEEAVHIVVRGTPAPVPVGAIKGTVDRILQSLEEKKIDPKAIERELEKEAKEREEEQKREQKRLESLAVYANSPAIQDPIEAHARGALARAAVAVEVLITTAQKIYEEYAARRAERQQTLKTEITKIAKNVDIKYQAQELFGTKRGQGPIYELAKSRGITFEGKMSNVTVVERHGQQIVRFAPDFELQAQEVSMLFVQTTTMRGGVSAFTITETTIRTRLQGYQDARAVSAAQERNLAELKQQKAELETEILADAKKQGYKANSIDELEHVRQFHAKIHAYRDYERKIEQVEAQNKEVQQDTQQSQVGDRSAFLSELMATVSKRGVRLELAESEPVAEHQRHDGGKAPKDQNKVSKHKEAIHDILNEGKQQKDPQQWRKHVSTNHDKGGGIGHNN